MAAAKGGWPVCDPDMRLAEAAYGGSKVTSTTVCGDEGRCVVCNLRKAGCSLIADCCTTVCSDEGRCVVRNLRKAACSRIADCCTTVCGAGGRCVVCNLPKAGCSLNADCCDGDRHEIKRDSRWLEIGVAEVPSAWPARSYCAHLHGCLLYTSPSPRDLSTSRMPSSA